MSIISNILIKACGGSPEGHKVILSLRSGEIIRGRIADMDGDFVILKHADRQTVIRIAAIDQVAT